MAENNRDFIIGGLPLNANDFANSSDVVTEKMELLSAITKINKLHEQKMSQNAPIQNVGVINNTIDYVKEENQSITTLQEEANNFKKDEYVYARDIVREPQNQYTPEANDQPYTAEPIYTAEEPVYQEPMYQEPEQDVQYDNYEPYQEEQPVYTEASEQPMYVNDEYSGPLDFQSEDNNQENPTMNEFTENGEPMYVIGEEEQKSHNKRKKAEKSNKNKKTCSPDEVKKGKGVAWMAYILFFLPLIFAGKNRFVKLHANEGLECNIIDALAVGMFLAGKFVKTTNEILVPVLLGAQVLGLALIALTTITKLMCIILSLAGKEAHSPWFGRIKFIKY